MSGFDRRTIDLNVLGCDQPSRRNLNPVEPTELGIRITCVEVDAVRPAQALGAKTWAVGEARVVETHDDGAVVHDEDQPVRQLLSPLEHFAQPTLPRYSTFPLTDLDLRMPLVVEDESRPHARPRLV